MEKYAGKTKFQANRHKSVVSILCIILFCLCIWAQFQLGIIFLGICIFTLPFVPIKHQPEQKEIKEEFADRTETTGIFTYDTDGFKVKFRESSLAVKWEEIQFMIAYKIDLVTTDEICLDIFHSGNKGFQITEETPGWFQFYLRSAERFPSIDKNWLNTICVPAFDPKRTLVYDKENRTLEKITALYSNSK